MSDWTYTRITTAEYDTASKNFGVVNSKAALDALHPIAGDYILSNFNHGVSFAVDGFCDDWDFVDHAGEGEIWDDVSVSSIDEDIPTGGIFYAHVYNDNDGFVEAWYKLENTGVDIGAGDTIFSAKVLERYESAPADTFSVGVPYVYNGSTWEQMDITRVENASKAWDCVSNAVSHKVQIPQSTNGLWMMCSNFVALNAVFQNLFSLAITILKGGSIQSEEFKDSETEHVGFRIDSDGNAVFANARLTGDSFFYGKFKCPTISSLPNTTGGTSVSASIRAFGGSSSANQWNDIYNFFTSNSLTENVTYNCVSSAYASVSYVKRTGEYFYFYNSSMGQAGVIGRDYSSFGSSYFCSGVTAAQTVTVSYGAGDILKLHDVQQGNAGLESDQIYWQSISGHRVLCIKP